MSTFENEVLKISNKYHTYDVTTPPSTPRAPSPQWPVPRTSIVIYVRVLDHTLEILTSKGSYTVIPCNITTDAAVFEIIHRRFNLKDLTHGITIYLDRALSTPDWKEYTVMDDKLPAYMRHENQVMYRVDSVEYRSSHLTLGVMFETVWEYMIAATEKKRSITGFTRVGSDRQASPFTERIIESDDNNNGGLFRFNFITIGSSNMYCNPVSLSVSYDGKYFTKVDREGDEVRALFPSQMFSIENIYGGQSLAPPDVIGTCFVLLDCTTSTVETGRLETVKNSLYALYKHRPLNARPYIFVMKNLHELRSALMTYVEEQLESSSSSDSGSDTSSSSDSGSDTSSSSDSGWYGNWANTSSRESYLPDTSSSESDHLSLHGSSSSESDDISLRGSSSSESDHVSLRGSSSGSEFSGEDFDYTLSSESESSGEDFDHLLSNSTLSGGSEKHGGHPDRYDEVTTDEEAFANELLYYEPTTDEEAFHPTVLPERLTAGNDANNSKTKTVSEAKEKRKPYIGGYLNPWNYRFIQT